MTLGTLGPEGTFSHQVAEKFIGHKIVFAMSVEDLFELYDQKILDKVLVPIENSLSGTVFETLEQLTKCRGTILAQETLLMKHHLASFAHLENIKKVYVHPYTYKLCKNFLNEHFLDLEISFALSDADSAKKLQNNQENGAAIVSEYAAHFYQLPLVFKNIQDKKNNKTRFVLIGEEQNTPTGKDQTSIVIYLKEDSCGQLVKVLTPFFDHHINLIKIESRPNREKKGSFRFFIDFEGHLLDDSVKKALKKIYKYKWLGSYSINNEQKRKS